MDSTRGSSSPGTRLSFWRTRLATRRAVVQVQFLTVVALIAILATTLITSLALLVVTTEEGAVRGALAESAGSDTEIRVVLTTPLQPTDEPLARTEKAVGALLGAEATATLSTMAATDMHVVGGADGRNRLLYFGEVQGVEAHSDLVDGVWPAAGSTDEIALPADGAAALSVGVGDTVTATTQRNKAGVVARVTGLYRSIVGTDGFWNPDRLFGEGLDPQFPVAGTAGSVRTDAVGPAIMADGALDTAGIPIDRLVARFSPTFSDTTVESLADLVERLSPAASDLPPAIGDVATRIEYSSGLVDVTRSITSAMAVTRSTVVAVSLLLLVLSAVALSQAARLLNEARVGERHLMRARGATSGQLLRLALVEAGLIAAGAAVLGALVARGVYHLVAIQPAMVASGIRSDAGLPPLVWAVALVSAILFGIVLIVPLLRGGETFFEGEQARARPRRVSGVQRSGIDVALVVLAGLGYWQLRSYQGTPGGAALGVDPVLAAGPALIMLAGALISVRLVPPVAALAERIANRSRGAVVSLAAWEVGRRAQRATAAILLLTLGLAIGTFGQSFLATWSQSQLDQAAFSVGAPLRITSTDSAVDAVAPLGAEPVLRLTGTIVASNEFGVDLETASGASTAIMGLTMPARDLLERGRLADDGGSTIAAHIGAPDAFEQPIALPDGTTGVAASIRVEPVNEAEFIKVKVRMLVEDAGGLQSLLDLGVVPADGFEYPVRALVPDGQAHDGLAVIAYQVQAFLSNPLSTTGDTQVTMRMLIDDLSALGTAPASTDLADIPATPVVVGAVDGWRVEGEGEGTTLYPRGYTVEGSPLGLSFTVPANLGSRTVSYAHMAWPPADDIDGVLSASLAERIRADVGDLVTLILNGIGVDVTVRAIAPAVPGAASGNDFGPVAGGVGETASTVVLDESMLARALFQAGSPAVATEWWMDVERGDAQAAVAEMASAHPDLTVQSAELLGLELQQHPVRVATQAALWVVIVGAIALAIAGFAVHAAGSLRSRTTEFAQLRAVGLTRRRLVAVIGLESLLLCVLGAVFGVGLGLVLAWLVGPLIGVSADGAQPIPGVQVVVPALSTAAMVAVLGVVLALVVLAAARIQRVADPTTALRQGEER